jgi:hypothetical protein
MTLAAPPTEFFPGINFNPSFYNLGQSALTLDYLNSNFLRSTGYAISRAQFTLFNGTVDINENLDVSGNINASAYLLNGVPFTPSQWTTSVNDIYYNTGNVGIGKTNPSSVYKLDVSGNINADKIFRAGTELTQYTDANVRTVLSTSVCSNMTWNTGTNKFDVPAPYTDTNTRTVLSTSACSNMTWNTGTNKFDVTVTSYTLPTAGTGSGGTLGGVKVDGSSITINSTTGIITATAATPYSLPIATNTILGGVRPDNTSIIVNSLTCLISLSGDNIILSNLANRDYGWGSTTSALGRAEVAGAYSTGSIIGDIVLKSAGNLRLQSGTTNPALVINTSNQALINTSLGVATTSITSGFVLDVSGNIVTSGNINLANTSRSIYWGSTNSNLARAGVAGEYSSSAAINDIVLRSGNKLLLQSGTGAAGVVIDTANNVGIGITNPLSILHLHKNTLTTDIRIILSDNTSTASMTRGFHIIKGNDNITRLWNYENTAMIFATNTTERMIITNTGNVGIGNTAPTGPLCVGNSQLAGSNGFIVIGKNNGSGGARSQYIGYNTNFDLVIGDYGGGSGPLIEAFKLSYNAPVNSLVINSGGNISMPNTVSIRTDRWHSSTEGAARVYYSPNNTTYLRGHGGTSFVFRNGADGDIASITSGGNLSVSGFLYAPSYIYTNGFLQGSGGGGGFRMLRPDSWVRLRDPGETTHLDFAAGLLYAHNELDVQGQATFNTLTIFNQYTVVYNTLQVRLTNISSTNTDYVCVAGNTSFNSVNDKALYIANGTFTGFHRNYTDDELFDPETPELFKNNFTGCIVISTGKIKTDYSTITEDEDEDGIKKTDVEWKSAIDKEGILIEDALPIIKLSRVKKDKRVFGVMGDPTRSNNNKERLIINSVGEGAICVCNTNGNIENGDYIQSSDILGHGGKQDDDILHNYTVAKATIDCNFELNSAYYECIERPDGIRTAFIACTYHCG